MYIDLGIRIENDIHVVYVYLYTGLYLHDLNLCPIAFTFRFRISGPPTAPR